eukprot:Gb_22603 [translate_table: standard]
MRPLRLQPISPPSACYEEIQSMNMHFIPAISNRSDVEPQTGSCISYTRLSSVDVDFHQQKVTVTSMLNTDQVLAAVKAKRKNAELWSSEAQLTLCKRAQPDSHSSTGKSNTSDSLDCLRNMTIDEDPGRSNKPAPIQKKKKKVTFQDEVYIN